LGPSAGSGSTLSRHGQNEPELAVGRRNWLIADTVGCANASTNLYSLLQTFVANGIDGYRYVKALLVGLPCAKAVEDFEDSLPWHIALDTA
jgi:hypothetical protein